MIQLASGEVFGSDQPIALKLLGSERSFQALEGMVLNTHDLIIDLHNVYYKAAVISCLLHNLRSYMNHTYYNKVTIDCCATAYIEFILDSCEEKYIQT